MRSIHRREMTMCKSSLSRLYITLLGVGIFLLLSTGAQSQDVWNGGSATAGPTNGYWSTAANWVAGTAPVANDSLTFNAPVAGGTRVTTNDLTAGTEFNNIVINGGQFFLSGNSISLGGTNPQFIVNSGTETINLSMALLQDTTFQVNTGGSNPLLINGVISGGFGLTKTGVSLMRFAALQTYSGDTTISSGTLDVTGDFMPSGSGKGNLTIVNGGTFQMNNASANINGLSGAGIVAKVGSGGRILTLGNNNADGVFTGNFVQNVGTLTITKTGSGTQVIGGTLNNTGTINVNGGTLLFNGTHTAGVGNYSVGPGATLGGTGLISFAATASLIVSNGGTLSPGNSAGLLRLNGGLGMTLQSNSNYAVELNGLGLGVDYDSVLVGSGTINIGNSVLAVSLGFTPNVGDQFDIVTNATGNAVLGEFAGLSEGSVFTVGSTDLQITYLGGTGNDIVLTVVPEPSSLGLIVFGLLGTYWLRRRSRQ
ncbi:MAG TPA: PEP-CTERM sorting domain-containing protein [Verrucomicrobiae bacterium]|nr:PEP-CTERM sorting domain-containing protein [Verrucomicrobiae bacterium]